MCHVSIIYVHACFVVLLRNQSNLLLGSLIEFGVSVRPTCLDTIFAYYPFDITIIIIIIIIIITMMMNYNNV